MITCPLPSCGVQLQPLGPTSTWIPHAVAYCAAQGVDVPTHGPAALTWLSVVAHAQVVHPAEPLPAYLEAYLSQ